MKKQLVILTSLVLVSIVLLPMAVKAQEKEKPRKITVEELIGKWQAEMAEVLNVPPAEPVKPVTAPADTTKKAATTGRPARTPEQIAQRQKADLENFIRNEGKSSLEILSNKTAIRTYNGKITTYTWKLKKNTLTAKDPITKYKYKVFIRKWTPDYLDIEETTRQGNIKVRVLYHRQQ